MSRSADNLYLLSFIDAMDRLDILMLEIRHLQQTIIYSLRAPSLYLPLRYEEKHLFGDDWEERITDLAGVGNDEKIASEWIIRYPTSKSAVHYYCEHEEAEKVEIDHKVNIIESIKNRMKHRIGQIWLGDNWVRDQRRQYHALYALQILKQHVLCDKISLARAALRANLIRSVSNKQHTVLQKPAFLILRKGVLFKVDEYVLILRNHKHQVGQSIAFGMPSDPHPSTERRRDMGIFMDFIFNRTIDIQRDILHLYQNFKGSDKKEDSLLMFHGWSQNTRVSTLQLDDSISASHNLFSTSTARKEEQSVGYINTSFWTPDRPDLHPMIAHPVAESVIRNTLNNLDEVVLSNSSDEFTEWVIRFKSIFVGYVQKTPSLFYLKDEIDKIANLIAADLLAATVKGVAYLYSLFLVIIGDNLASQLSVGKDIKLDMVYSLEQGTTTYEESILWYLRLHIVATWVDNIIEKQSDIDKNIIGDIKQISNELLAFLNNYTPLSEDKLKPVWEELLALFVREIEKNKGVAVTTARKWRSNREKDNDKHNRDYLLDKGKNCFSRSTRKLNIRLQNYLFREVLSQKKHNGKPLVGTCNLEEKIKAVYSLEVTKFSILGEDGHSLHHPDKLFDHIYDISYQTAYLRSIDMLSTGSLSGKDLFDQLHWDMELGRGLFSIALEFYMRDIESPEQRLSLCINQIAYIYEDIDAKEEVAGLVKALKVWLKPDENEVSLDDIPLLIETLSQDSHALGANKLADAFEKIRFCDAKYLRQLEVIAGYKLKDLFKLLENEDNYNHNERVKKSFSALVQFLSLRRCDSDRDDRPSKKALFYNRMLAALGDIKEEEKQQYEKIANKQAGDNNIFNKKFLPAQGVKSIMLHRLSITNYAPISDPVYLSSATKNHNGRYLAKNLIRRSWKTHLHTKDEQAKTWITLGRFDAVSMLEVKLPCKCYIQGFKEGQSLPYRDESCLDEAFAPHFSRREIARPVEIIPRPASESHQMFSMLSVTLQRRSIRLDFLYRMIRALKKDSLQNFQSGIEEQILRLESSKIFVKGYLTDGWGDVLFKFSKGDTENGENKLSESDIEKIFDFQRAVYEDFMVDRTEIIFTPQCLDHTLAHTDKYRITMEARMLEDRWLETGVENYTSNLRQTIAELREEKNELDFLDDVEIIMTPGRNDFSFRFMIKNKEFFAENSAKYPNKYIKDAYSKIIEWLDKNEGSTGAMHMLSHIETSIGKVLR